MTNHLEAGKPYLEPTVDDNPLRVHQAHQQLYISIPAIVTAAGGNEMVWRQALSILDAPPRFKIRGSRSRKFLLSDLIEWFEIVAPTRLGAAGVRVRLTELAEYHPDTDITRIEYDGI